MRSPRTSRKSSPRLPQPEKSPHAATKTQCSQKKKNNEVIDELKSCFEICNKCSGVERSVISIVEKVRDTGKITWFHMLMMEGSACYIIQVKVRKMKIEFFPHPNSWYLWILSILKNSYIRTWWLDVSWFRLFNNFVYIDMRVWGPEGLQIYTWYVLQPNTG